jgi:sugar (pentulose or hexulose) kinase
MPLYVEAWLRAWDRGSRRAALLAGVAAGAYRDVEDASHRALRLAEVIEPNPEFAARYAQLAHTFKALYSATQVTPVPSG